MSKRFKVVLVLSLIANLGIVYVAYKALEYRAHINEYLDKYNNVVNEFSGRGFYLSDNDELAATDPDSSRVVFIGSQLTENWDVADCFPEFEAINRGISGQRLAGFVLRFPSDVIRLQPAAVVIEFASYNFRVEHRLEEIQDYVISLATLARANDIEPILTTVIPTRVNLYPEGYSVSDSVVKFNDWLRGYCNDKDYRLVDFYAVLSDTNGLLPLERSASAIKPNAAGYDLISEATRELLRGVE